MDLLRRNQYLHQCLFIIINLIAAFFSPLKAQLFGKENFDVYTKKAGLSGSIINGIAQDEWGYFWIGTDLGVDVFDGLNFNKVSYDEGHATLTGFDASTPKKLLNNSIGVLTQRGVVVVSPAQSVVLHLNVPVEKDMDFNYYSNNCFDVETDADGNYALSTYNGFYIFSPDGNLVERYDKIKPGEGRKVWYRFGRSIYRLPDGNLLQHNADGFLVYNRQKRKIEKDSASTTLIKYLFDEGYKKKNRFFQLPGNRLMLLHQDNNKIVIIDRLTAQIRELAPNFSVKDKLRPVEKCFPLNDSTFLIPGTGISKIVINERQRNARMENESSFSQTFLNEIFVDKENKLWLATSEGLFKQRRSKKIVTGFMVPPPNFNTNPFFGILDLHSAGNRIFVGTTGGILVFDLRSKKMIREIDLSPIDPKCNKISRMITKSDDTIWAGTASGLVWIHSGNFNFGRVANTGSHPGLSDHEISFLFQDSRKNVWIRTAKFLPFILFNFQTKGFESTEGLVNSSHPEVFFNSFAGSAAEDSAGNIWFAGDYLIRYNNNANHFDSVIRYVPDKALRIRSAQLLKIQSGEIWLSTGHGIYRLTNSGIVQSRVLTEIGRQGVGFSLAGHSDTRIVFTFSSGIGILNTKEDDYVVFTREDSLPADRLYSDVVNDPATGTFYFYHKNYLFWIGDSAIRLKSNSPIVHIMELEILNDTIIKYPPSKLILARNQNDIRISFSAPNFNDPLNMRFSYRLRNGKDSVWIVCTKERSLLLSNISPGTYQLEIKVESVDNKWPVQFTRMLITVQPAFWQRTWFKILAAVLLISIIYLVFRYRVRRIRQQANIDKQLAELEMKGLHSQMNPHFVFNSLNSIREMILNNENKDASHYLSKFAHLLRITLDHSAQSLVSLRNTLEYLMRYIEMEQIRNNQFTYNVFKDDGLDSDETMIPPMLIQPFIENALWHGVSPGNKDIHIRLEFKKNGDNLVCVIDDDGIGINQGIKEKNESGVHHHSVGISNIRNRIALLNEKYDIGCSITIQDKSGLRDTHETGTLVTIKLPLDIKHA